MASEWTTVRLGEICKFAGGSAFPKKYQGSSTGPIPFIKVSDMNLPANARRIVQANNWIDEDVASQTRARRHPTDAVVFAKIGVALTYNRRRILTMPTAIDNNMMAAIPNRNAVDPLFMYYLLTTVDFNEVVAGTALPYLNASDLATLEVDIPSDISEQRAIAHILGTLDDKIELNRQMSETLEAMARALFKSCFVDFEPVRAKDEGRDPGVPHGILKHLPDSLTEQADFGEIPDGWIVGALGDVAEHPRRGVQPNQVAPSTPYIGLEHMPRRSIALGQWSKADGLGSSKFEFKRGEILFGKLRPYFHKVGVAPVDGVCSTDIVVVRPKAEAWFGFVLGHLSSTTFVDYTTAGSTGTKMPRTSWGEMARYPIAVPPREVAGPFTAQIRPIVDRINSLIYEARTLASLRDALLPKLLSAELYLGPQKEVCSHE